MKALPVFALAAALAWSSPRTLIVDTDAGSDDMMAIAFLLSRDDVHIEAITVANGLAHVPRGAKNILRLLALSGKSEIPVYMGRETPSTGNNAFPDAWRLTSDEMPSVDLPPTKRAPESQSAVDYLVKRLGETSRPVSILALGPLTNIAEALTRFPQGIQCVEDMAIMGGAVRVPGNLADGGYFRTENTFAEWNLFVDSAAAAKVFSSGVRFRLVPLDATNQVPIDRTFLDRFKAKAKTPLAKAVTQILESERPLIAEHIFYAWDPLAAVAIVNPDVLKMSFLPIELEAAGPHQGRTKEVAGHPANTRVALEADAALFRKIFLEAFDRIQTRKAKNNE